MAINIGRSFWCAAILGFMAVGVKAEPPNARPDLPVREITVFKDGHAFVLHAGRMPVNAAGEVQIDTVPNPILGAFWPYSADKSVTLDSVTTEKAKASTKRTALNVRELLQANAGARVTVVQTDKQTYEAQVVDVPHREPSPNASPAPDPNLSYPYYNNYGGGFGGGSSPSPSASETVLLKTNRGTAAVPLSLIQSVTFHTACKRELEETEYRSRLTLHLLWPGGKPKPQAAVGMMYLQKGVRWIPSYRITLDGEGNAAVRLQATLLNEMVDLKDVTVHLVVGVPNFLFSDTPDPIALQQGFPTLSRYFQGDTQTAYALSNAIMGQQAGFGGGGFGGGRQADAAPPGKFDQINTDRNEDLFVFTVKHVTLPKGASMALPVADYPLKYRDLYRLELAFTPPDQVQRNNSLNQQQQAEIDRLQRQPKAEHRLRFINNSRYPFTTAPALILKGDRVIAQTLMTYTSVGSAADIALTTAVDVRANKSEHETKRTPDAVTWGNRAYTRIDMTGSLDMTNYADRTIDLEVVRYLPGSVDQAENGRIEMINILDGDAAEGLNLRPNWWGYYYWPYWWDHFNGLARVSWNLKLEKGKSANLEYKWHYFVQ